MKTQEYYDDIGLFRFSLIVPVLNNTHGYTTKDEYFRETAAKIHTFQGKNYKFTVSCLRKWYQNYKKLGYDALKKQERDDKRKSRKLNNETILRIIELREEFPHITGSKIYQKLIEEEYFSKEEISKDTILRFLRMNNLKASQVTNIERRMFEMENINDCCYTNLFKIPTFMINPLFYKEIESN